MNREEIEKLIEETARKERSKRKGVSVQKVRSILNVVFMLCAVAGLILYFAWPDNRLAHLFQHRPLSVQACASKSLNSFCASCFNRLNHD
mgnify:CR=1 FL=1